MLEEPKSAQGGTKGRRKSADLLEELSKKKADRWANFDTSDKKDEKAEDKKVLMAPPTRKPVRRGAELHLLPPCAVSRREARRHAMLAECAPRRPFSCIRGVLVHSGYDGPCCMCSRARVCV
jgi:hypothetical protein